MTKEAIWEDYWDFWVAENGLGKLASDHTYEQHYDGLNLRSPANENGILFLAYFLILAKAAGMNNEFRSKRLVVGQTIERLIRAPYRGLFDRIPIGDKKELRTPERHDNYVAIVTLSMLYGFSFHKEIVSYGNEHGYNFNNITPEDWDVKSQRQGGEIAFYQICAGYVPEVLNFIWMIGGIFASMFDKDPGRSNLAWLRLYALDKADIQNAWVKIPLIIVTEIWKAAKWINSRNLVWSMEGYFSGKHPNYKMARVLGEDNWGF